MRTRFFEELERAAHEMDNVVLVVGDLGFGVVDSFVSAHPSKFVNAGVAEQNMTGMAAGMALAGAKVFTYSIGNFPTLRCLEQIRNDVVYHGADVTVVAVGGGLAYGALGMSHHATEDLAILRAVPGLKVASPGDPEETGAVMAQLLALGGPAYLRLGKAGEKTVHAGRIETPVGEAYQLREGDAVCLMSTGAMLPEVVDAADNLAEQGVSASILSFPWIAPFDSGRVVAAGQRHRLMVSIEEHTVVGGLGGAAAEVLAEQSATAPLLRIGLPHRFSSVVGDQNHLREVNQLTARDIANAVIQRLKEIS